jgi:hypothetical protein
VTAVIIDPGCDPTSAKSVKPEIWDQALTPTPIILSDRNALNSVHKFFLHTMKNRLPDPSEICALEFKGEFRRFKICLVLATIGIDWSIFDVL